MEEGPGPAPKAATQAAQKNLFWAASTALTNRSRISLPSRKVYLLDCCTNCNCNAMQGRDSVGLACIQIRQNKW